MGGRRRRSVRTARGGDSAQSAPDHATPAATKLRPILLVGSLISLAAIVFVMLAAIPAHSDDTPTSQPAPAAAAPQTPPAAEPTLTAATTPAAPPNVVIFLIDTLRADRLGTYGYRHRETSPVIDQLARDGVVFEHAYSAAPWTLPSVVSLFLSQFPCEHNVLSTYDRLPDSADTLAERFKRLGYNTFMLYGNGFLEAEFGTQQGFDVKRKFLITDGQRVAGALGATPPQPFFLYIHNVEPHDPYFYAPPHTPGFRDVSREIRMRIRQYTRQYKAAGEYDYRQRLPLGTNDQTEIQDQCLATLLKMTDDIQELYDAAVHIADVRVGATIAALQARGVWDNTIFILLADHGEALGKRGSLLHDQSVYEEMTHVPLVIRFPHNQFAGLRIADPVSLVDVLPTLFQHLGRPDLAADARGRNLLPLLHGQPLEPAAPFFIPGLRLNRTRYYRPWAEKRGDTNIIIRHGPWKGIWNQQIGTFELFNLSTDPEERRNVRDEHPELVRGMREYAASWYERCQQATTETEAVGDLSPETLELLRQLGYAE